VLAKQIDLVDGLGCANIAQLVWAIGGQHNQGNACVKRLNHRRQEVRRRRARGTYQRHGRAQHFRHTQRKKARRALIDMHPQPRTRLARNC
jgi:hypothetical protein